MTLYISAAVDLSSTVLIIVKVNYRKDKHLGYTAVLFEDCSRMSWSVHIISLSIPRVYCDSPPDVYNGMCYIEEI